MLRVRLSIAGQGFLQVITDSLALARLVAQNLRGIAPGATANDDSEAEQGLEWVSERLVSRTSRDPTPRGGMVRGRGAVGAGMVIEEEVEGVHIYRQLQQVRTLPSQPPPPHTPLCPRVVCGLSTSAADVSLVKSLTPLPIA